jgi:hypothetical protein
MIFKQTFASRNVFEQAETKQIPARWWSVDCCPADQV